jgi:hypothetical protein
MREKLLRCPFCDSGSIRTKVEDEAHWEVCGGCGATGPLGNKRSDEDDPTWNTRATDTELTRIKRQVEVLRGCLQVEAERSTSEITRAHAQARLADADRIAKGEV